MIMNNIFRDIVENTLEGIIVIGSDYRIKYMNRVAGDITGFTNENAIEKYCYEVLRAKRCKDFCPIKESKKGKLQEDLIINILAKNNSEKYIKAKVIETKGYWVEIFQDVTREIELEKRIKKKYILQDIITRDKGLIEILNQFPSIAASKVPVLLEGESGVGKEVFCSALQSLSPRNNYPFVKLNCAALPETLLESELFGYKKGAFTDAGKDKPGLFVLANNGTLFLDEIGEMPLSLQAKLLRAVETGEIIPLGAIHPEKIDIRLIAATNKDLNVEVKKGKFRKDLFYRLNVVNIHIPPLRERKNDIPLFLELFLHQFNLIQQKKVQDFSPDAMKILLNHHYPGNIRELRNIVEYAFIFCSQKSIQPEHLPKYLFLQNRDKPNTPLIDNDETNFRQFISNEKDLILDTLVKNHWNKQKTAQALHIDRTTLWRKIKKFEIEIHPETT